MFHTDQTHRHHAAVDAYTLTWSSLMFYAFPPFSLIGTVLSKIKKDKARGWLCYQIGQHNLGMRKPFPWGKNHPLTHTFTSVKRPVDTSQPSKRDTSIVQKTVNDDLSLIRESLELQNLSESTKEIIMASWRKGTQKQYKSRNIVIEKMLHLTILGKHMLSNFLGNCMIQV